MRASIIIRTYNEERRIGECLRSVCSQKTAFPFEVIVVDSESTDKTVAIVSRFPAKIVHVPKAEFTPGKSLNTGCLAASGEYFVFLSGHAVPTNNQWLQTLINNFESPDIAGVYGKQIPLPGCHPWETRLLFEEWPAERKVQTADPFFSAVNAAIKRERWKEIRFNERNPKAEDQEWARDMQRGGYGILYDPETAVYHSHNTGMMGACERFSKEIHGLYLVHGEHIFPRLFSDIRRTTTRDISFIRARRYGARWIWQSLVRNALFFLTLLYAVVSLPCGWRWIMHSVGRIFSPLRLAYRISAALRLHSPAYGRFIDRVKKRSRRS